MGPIIGITVSADADPPKSLIPGHPMFFTDVEYAHAVELAGGIPIMLPMVEDQSHLRDLLNLVDGLIISGEMRSKPRQQLIQPLLPTLQQLDPKRYIFEARLIGGALHREMPLIGTCRGCQMINELTGGTMHLRIPTGADGPRVEHLQQVPGDQPVHRIHLTADSHLTRILGCREVEVNSFHRQAVHEVGPSFRISATADDGVVEAIESRKHPFALGLQFHPERLVETRPVFLRIFEALIEASGRYGHHKRRRRSRASGR